MPSPLDPDDLPTALLPPVAPPVRPSFLRKWLPWAGFAMVAVVIVAATTAWATSLRPAADTELQQGNGSTPDIPMTSSAVQAEESAPSRARLPASAPAAPVAAPQHSQPARAVVPTSEPATQAAAVTTAPVVTQSPPPVAATTAGKATRNPPACSPGIMRGQVMPGCATTGVGAEPGPAPQPR